jgi:MFS family permease
MGRVNSDFVTYSLPFSMAATPLASYAFDIFGRKVPITLSFIATAVLFAIIPYTAPDIDNLMIVRCLIAVTTAPLLCHPLIPDYVKAKSRGKAVALAGVGIVIGEILGLGVIFNLIKDLEYSVAFGIVAFLVVLFGVFFWVATKDPDIDLMRKRQIERLTVIERS